MRTATTRLQSESDAWVMGNFRALRNKKKGLEMEVTNLIQQEVELEAELHQSSKHSTAARGRVDAVKRELAASKGELTTSRVTCTIL